MVWVLTMSDLANFLLQNRFLSPDQLANTQAEAIRSQSPLEDVILAKGLANPSALYRQIAAWQKLEFADLYTMPCEEALLLATMRDDYLRLRAIPWKQEGDMVVIATCTITDALHHWAHRYFPKYRFAITSPFDIHHSLNHHFHQQNSLDALRRLWRKHPEYSARDLFRTLESKVFALCLSTLVVGGMLYPKPFLLGLFVIVTFFYIGTLLFKTLLFLIGLTHVPDATPPATIPDHALPIYTILIPLYKEDKVLAKLTNAIRALDYPKSKLDVKLIVEADDEVTIAAIKALRCERMFEMVPVPYSLPRTKPKACNYALRFARGEFVTIYDAEDIPHPQQLKTALAVFAREPEEVVCLQARLNYFNREENWLSRFFAIEYATLFDFLLPGLEAMGIPIPLGGTSNHFKMAALQALYAWDPYNVTEDADLGLRIAQKGWRCKVIPSLTLEECPVRIGAWVRQRSRWIKGHMQTYFVHMRKPFVLWKKLGTVGFFGFQFFLGVPAFIFLIAPFMWLLCLLWLTGALALPPDMPGWFGSLVSISLWLLPIGATLHFLQAFATVHHHGWRDMGKYCIAFPFYWILHSIASFRALWQLITRPHYWEKTQHGVTKVKTEST